ncbi:MAG: hypothetical protein ACW98U_13525 [Candidatus Thorarchaeota archaeon]
MKWNSIGVILLLVGIIILSPLKFVDGNPYILPDSAFGSLWSNSTFVEMPYAEVLLEIDYLGQSLCEIDVTGNYTLRTNETQECSLAFAYPSSWNGGFPHDEEIAFDITLNDTAVTTWSVEFENASWIRTYSGPLFQLSCEPDFVGFNVSLSANTTYILGVETCFNSILTHDATFIAYVCGTATSFKGSVVETITVVVNELEPLSYIGFEPETNLTIMNNEVTTHATWELYYVPEMSGFYFPVDVVYTYLVRYENDTMTTTPSTTTLVGSTTTTTTTPADPSSTQADMTPRIVIGGALGFSICVAIFLLWQKKKPD